jgi:NDP-sugar pyrophosphorylase family protein
MQCVILAGGLATRLAELTRDVPKALVSVAGRPFADLQLSWLASEGVTEVVYCVGHLGDQIRGFVGDGSRWGVRAAYVDEGSELRGTAGALRLALDTGSLADEFAVLYADSYLRASFADLWRDFGERGPSVLMAVFRNEDRFDRSNVKLDRGLVVRYDKNEPDPIAAGMHHIDYGLSVIDRDSVIAEIPARKTLDLADVYRRLAAEGRIAAHEVAERFYEIGSPTGLAELEAALSAGTIEAPTR